VILPLAAAALALGPGASAARPPVSLSVSPARVALSSGTLQTIRVSNVGARAALVAVSTAGFALDMRGRARIVRQRPGSSWLALRPRRLALPPGATASLAVTALQPPGARPGDHDALVLLTSAATGVAGVAVRMRIGVVVAVRVPGTVVRRLEVRSLRVRRPGLLELSVANRGNVTERLPSARLRISLRRGGRLLARLRPAARELLPRSRGLAELRYPGRLRGRVTAVVEVARAPGGAVLRRTFRVLLPSRQPGA
jgi:hypothetical protein